MTENQMQELVDNLNKPLDGNMGCGTWNVHQRLSFLYGEDAGLSYEHTPGGGVKVSITWYNNINE
jgi:two-component system sensor histidine kinase YesM